jgi:hypothetical protein
MLTVILGSCFKKSDLSKRPRLEQLLFESGFPQEVKSKEDTYALLLDSAYSDLWAQIIPVIATTYPGNESARVLTSFFIRDETVLDVKIIEAKYSAVLCTGIAGGTVADEFLKKALTDVGARDLSSRWIYREVDVGFPQDSDMRIITVRGHAAMGLAYTGKDENAKEIRDLRCTLEEELADTPFSEEKSRTSMKRLLTKQQYEKFELWRSTGKALASYDLMQKIGKQQYLQLSFEETMPQIEPYLIKYKVEVIQDGVPR